ncbi:hypothetical protein, partial [Halorubrum sp. SS7]|uniref:hypothetical protein n=1 Tax=Halorubrum sp. SS7 TaxID=2518119 RepID=UPI001A7E0AFB
MTELKQQDLLLTPEYSSPSQTGDSSLGDTGRFTGNVVSPSSCGDARTPTPDTVFPVKERNRSAPRRL